MTAPRQNNTPLKAEELWDLRDRRMSNGIAPKGEVTASQLWVLWRMIGDINLPDHEDSLDGLNWAMGEMRAQKEKARDLLAKLADQQTEHEETLKEDYEEEPE